MLAGGCGLLGAPEPHVVVTVGGVVVVAVGGAGIVIVVVPRPAAHDHYACFPIEKTSYLVKTTPYFYPKWRNHAMKLPLSNRPKFAPFQMCVLCLHDIVWR